MSFSLSTFNPNHPFTNKKLFAATHPDTFEEVDVINDYIYELSSSCEYSTLESNYYAIKKFYEYFTVGLELAELMDIYEKQPLIISLLKNYPFYLSVATAYDSYFNVHVRKETGHKTLSDVNKDLSHVAQFLKASHHISKVTSDAESEELSTLNAVDFHSHLQHIKSASGVQKKFMRTNTLLGSVIKQSKNIDFSNYWNLPRSLKSRKSQKLDKEKLYPFSKFNDLLSAAKLREQLVYLLMGGAGLRSHEANQIRLEDFVEGVLKIRPYEDRKLMDGMSSNDVAHLYKQKGRNTEDIFWIPGYEREFYKRMTDYFQLRTHLLHKGGIAEDHGFVFVMSKPSRKYPLLGRPLYMASRVSQDNTFANLNAKIEVENKTRHSLRHMYGTYMLNEIPTKNGKGLKLEQVMKIMGHANLASTQVYAHIDEDQIIENLKYAEDVFNAAYTTRLE